MFIFLCCALSPSMLWFYNRFFFAPILGLHVILSKLVLFTMVETSVVAGAVITFKRRRTFSVIVVMLLLPFEIYTVIAYFSQNLIYGIISVSIALALCAAQYALILGVHSKKQRKRKLVKKWQLLKMSAALPVTIISCLFPFNIDVFISIMLKYIPDPAKPVKIDEIPIHAVSLSNLFQM